MNTPDITPPQQTPAHHPHKPRVISDIMPNRSAHMPQRMAPQHITPRPIAPAPTAHQPTVLQSTSPHPTVPHQAAQPTIAHTPVAHAHQQSTHAHPVHAQPTTHTKPTPVQPIHAQPGNRYNNFPVNLKPATPVRPIQPAGSKTSAYGQHYTPAMQTSVVSGVEPSLSDPVSPTTAHTHKAPRKTKPRIGLRVNSVIAWLGTMVTAVAAGLFVPVNMFTQTVCIVFGVVAFIIGLPSKYSFGMALTTLVATMITQALEYEDASSSLAVAAFLLLCAGTLCLLRETVLGNKRQHQNM